MLISHNVFICQNIEVMQAEAKLAKKEKHILTDSIQRKPRGTEKLGHDKRSFNKLGPSVGKFK